MYTHTHTHTHTWTHACTLTLACTLLYISHLCKLELVNSPECDRHKQAYETASHVLCDCKTLDFMKPGDLEEICVIRILHFVQKYQVWSRCMGHYCARSSCFLTFCSILFYTYHQSKVQSSDNRMWNESFNLLNPELNSICYLLALLEVHHFLHVSRIKVKLLTLRRLMSYIYGAPILHVSRSHTTTQHRR